MSRRLTVDPASVRLDRLNAGAPLLDTHNAYQLAAIIGSVVPGTARIESGKGLATVKLSRAEGCADIVQNIRDGIITNISVGYNVHAFTRTEAADGSPAVMTATDWEPVELSAVPVPADPGAQIRLAQRSAAGLEVTPCTITRADPGSQSEATTMAKDTKPVAAGKGHCCWRCRPCRRHLCADRELARRQPAEGAEQPERQPGYGCRRDQQRAEEASRSGRDPRAGSGRRPRPADGSAFHREDDGSRSG